MTQQPTMAKHYPKRITVNLTEKQFAQVQQAAKIDEKILAQFARDSLIEAAHIILRVSEVM
jgi:uncharacterized protein (DUF1778 family)